MRAAIAFEEFQSMSEEPLTKCPKCGKKKLRRLFGTGAAVLFKGSGFYETDYRSESYKKAAKADQEAGKPSDAKASAAKPRKPGRSARPTLRRRLPRERQEKCNEKTQVRRLSGR